MLLKRGKTNTRKCFKKKLIVNADLISTFPHFVCKMSFVVSVFENGCEKLVRFFHYGIKDVGSGVNFINEDYDKK